VDKGKNGVFWESVESELEKGIETARREKRNVRGVRIVWHLFFMPAVVFAKSLFLSFNIARGRAGLRDAVHSSVFHFAVNARLYELDHGDRSELEKIKNEW